MGCLSSTLGSTGKMVPEVPAASLVETVYSTDKNGVSTAVIVNGHRTPGHEQPVSPDRITIEEDPTAGALTTKKVIVTAILFGYGGLSTPVEHPQHFQSYFVSSKLFLSYHYVHSGSMTLHLSTLNHATVHR